MINLHLFLLATVWGAAMGDTGPSDYSELDPARDPATPLKPGSSGSEVVALQNALAGMPYHIALQSVGAIPDIC